MVEVLVLAKVSFCRHIQLLADYSRGRVRTYRFKCIYSLFFLNQAADNYHPRSLVAGSSGPSTHRV